MTVIAGICSDNFYHQNITPIYTDTNRSNMFISHNIINTPNENIIKIDFHAHVCISICIFRCKQRCTRGYKRYKETSGLIEWKECQIFHSIFT